MPDDEEEPLSPQEPTEEDDDEEEYDLRFPSEYHGKKEQSAQVVEEVKGHDGKVQRIYDSGRKQVVFTNGVRREVFPDGYSIVYFNNQDIK